MVAGTVVTHWQHTPAFIWGADASLVLARGRADISSLTVNIRENPKFTLPGRLVDFHDPRMSGEYHGVVDLGELASITRQPQVRKGTAQFEGKAAWSLRNFSTDGIIAGKGCGLADGSSAMREWPPGTHVFG